MSVKHRLLKWMITGAVVAALVSDTWSDVGKAQTLVGAEHTKEMDEAFEEAKLPQKEERFLEEEPSGIEGWPEMEESFEMGEFPETERLTEQEVEKETETETQGEEREDDAKEKRSILVAGNGKLQVTLCLPEGNYFPEGAILLVRSVTDVIGERPEKEILCHEWEESLKLAWKDVLIDHYIEMHQNVQDEQTEKKLTDCILESVRAFLPYYIAAVDAQGQEMVLPDGTEIRFTIRDGQFYQDALERNDIYNVAYQGEAQTFRVMKDKEVYRDDKNNLVQINVRANQSGWYSVLQMDGQWILKPDSETKEETGQEIQSVEELTDVGNTFPIEETFPAGEIFPGEEFISGEENDEKDASDEEERMNYPVAYAALAPTGTKVTASGSGFVKMTTGIMDGSYRSVRWYNGISSFSLFNSAGSSVKMIQSDYNGNRQFFYPLNDNAKGKFGGIYYKILYQNGVWYDLKMTVMDYTNHTYVGSDGSKVKCYPPIGFNKGSIKWYLKALMGEYLLKMEFYKNGDASQTPVKLNTRFQWWEIDSAQRFGIRVGDGSISAKYYQADNAEVRCKTEKPEVDSNTNYLMLAGTDEDLTGADQRGNVGFSLTGCSTYYMVVGFKDHIKDDAAYRTSKAKIEEWSELLASGVADGIGIGVLTQSDVDVPIPPDTSYPQKFVSNDGASWVSANTLSSKTATYYYKIRQYVPWQTEQNYYSAFAITDSLPAGVDYVGGLSVRRVEDNADVTSNFTCSVNNDTVTAVPTAAFLTNSGFYGFTFDITFQVCMDPTEITAQYVENTATYRVVNKASVRMVFAGGSAYSSNSNEVTTVVSVARKEQASPRKSIDGEESLTEKQLTTANDTILFSIYQTVPANDALWLPAGLTITDTLADCLEFISAQVYEKNGNDYMISRGWSTSASGQTVTISKAFQPDNMTFRFDLICKIRPGYDLEAYAQKWGNRMWYIIPNTAWAEVIWAHGNPSSVKKQTNEVTVQIDAGPVTVHLQLTKEIDAKDIVWAHGNPTFIFCITGEDIEGKKHTFYEMVEFTVSNTGDGRAALTADVKVPAGWYTAFEEQTIRYTLKEIHSVTGGNATGNKAVFDVSAGNDAAATFYNVKTTDEGESHSAFVRNVIGETEK